MDILFRRSANVFPAPVVAGSVFVLKFRVMTFAGQSFAVVFSSVQKGSAFSTWLQLGPVQRPYWKQPISFAKYFFCVAFCSFVIKLTGLSVPATLIISCLYVTGMIAL